MILEIKYKGHTGQPSDYECPDGDLDVAINLVPEDGALRPVHAPSTIMALGEKESVVFVHTTNAFTHYVIYDGEYISAVDKVDTSTRLTFHKEKSSGKEHEPMTSIPSAELFSAVGNVLIVKTASSVHYFLWKTDDPCYLYLGTHLPELRLTCGLSYDIVRTGKNGKYFPKDPKYFYTDDDDENKTGTAESGDGEEDGFVVDIKHPIQNMTDDWSTTEMSSDGYRTDEENITATVLAKVNKFIQEQSVKKGRFIFPFLVRFAYRLYDGSLAMHTAPILMIPSDACTPAVVCSFLHFDGGLTDFKCITTAALARLRVTFDSYDEMKNWKDIITSLDVFISKPIYTYNQNGNCYRLRPISEYNPNIIGAYKGTANSDCQTTFWKAYYNKFKNSLNVSSFLKKVSTYNDFIKNSYCVEVPKRSDDEITSDIRQTANFYLLHSYKVDELAKNIGIVPVEDDYLQSLTSREVMTDDYDSHDSLLPNAILAYNGRLNMGAVRKTLFGGFVPYMTAQYQHDTSSGHSVTKREAYVYIRMDDGVHVVKAADDNPISNGEIVYLLYPNSRAYKAIVYDGTKYHEYNLESHPFLENAAFYYAGFHDTGKVITSLPADCVPDDNPTVDMGNKVYNSDVNNPFHFTATNIYTVGTGRILGISTAAKALSEGQFGQFPLYAFTTEGVWALEVSSTTGAYSAKQPITRDVCNNAESITQLDSAVLFTTDRGIMLISGSQTACISDTIKRDVPFSLKDMPKTEAILAKTALSLPQLDFDAFIHFLNNCGMVYDYNHQRVIVFNPKHEYAYVYSLKDKAWGMAVSSITSAVQAYPDALAMTSSHKLVNYSVDDEASKTDGVDYIMFTRPLKLGVPDVQKTVNAIIQRGMFKKGHAAQVLYASRDLFSWRLVWSSKDQYLRGFRGTPYKYFRLAVIGYLMPGESLHGATVQFEARHNNQPR